MITYRPTRQKFAARHESAINRAASSLANSGFRQRVHTVRKIIVDRNPTVMVGKCAGLFLRAQWLGVAELRLHHHYDHHHDRVASCSFAFLRRVSAGSMERRAPVSPFAPSSPKRPSLWRRRAPPSTDHASQWRGDLCEPIAPSQLKAPKFGRRSSLARCRSRQRRP